VGGVGPLLAAEEDGLARMSELLDEVERLKACYFSYDPKGVWYTFSVFPLQIGAGGSGISGSSDSKASR